MPINSVTTNQKFLCFFLLEQDQPDDDKILVFFFQNFPLGNPLIRCFLLLLNLLNFQEKKIYSAYCVSKT